MRKSMPAAVFMGLTLIAAAIFFGPNAPTADADVAGMNYIDLRNDRDFEKAVEYIVERCEVDGNEIEC